MSNTMNAMVVSDGILTSSEVELPNLSEDQVLIRVHAAGVNRPDILQKQGAYPAPEGHSDILGLEVAGTIEKVGAKVVEFTDGQEVVALTDGGGYAEYVVVNAGQVLPKPAALSMEEAAALPEALFTLCHHVFLVGGMRAGGSMLVHGGTSGIGLMMLKLAQNMNIHVFATVSNPQKQEALHHMGFENVLVRDQDDIAGCIKAAVGGVDMVLEMAGGKYLPESLSALHQGGTLLLIGMLDDVQSTIKLSTILMKQLRIVGLTLRNQPKEVKQQVAKTLQQHMWPLIEQGQLLPHIDEVFAFDQAEEAHQKMLTNQHIGKIVLKVA